jgi:hypothetical protein
MPDAAPRQNQQSVVCSCEAQQIATLKQLPAVRAHTAATLTRFLPLSTRRSNQKITKKT